MKTTHRIKRLDEIARLLAERIDATRDPEAGSSLRAFRRAADTIPVVVWTAGPDGRVTWFNRHYYEFSGAASLNYMSLIHPEDREAHIARWDESRRLERPHEGRSRILSDDGQYNLMVTRANPVREAGAVIYWVGSTVIVAPMAELEIRAA